MVKFLDSLFKNGGDNDIIVKGTPGGGLELSVDIDGSSRSLSSEIQFHRARPFAAMLPGNGVAGQVLTTGVYQFLQLYNAALVGRIILTWFPQAPAAISTPLATICDPYLNLFRGIIPPLGGTIDLSPILAFVVLDFFTNSAAALPAEIGPDGKPVLPKGNMFAKKREASREVS